MLAANKTNILVLGFASAEQYSDKIAMYCDPDSVVITTLKEFDTDSIKDAAKSLGGEFLILDKIEEFKDHKPNKILVFTSEVDALECDLLKEANKEKIEIIFISP
jgi:hypothetical protein